MASQTPLSNSSLPPVHKIPQDMIVSFWNLCGALHLAPRIIRSVMDYVCRSKPDRDDYRTYAQKIRGEDISDELWKSWCRFSGVRLQTEQNLNRMDTTDLFCLLQVLSQVRTFKVTSEKLWRPEIMCVPQQPIDESVQTDHLPGLKNIADASKSNPPLKGEQRKTQAKRKTGKKQLALTGGEKYKLLRNAAVQTIDDTSKIVKKMQAVKNLRNITMHSEQTARDPTTFCKLVPALHELIDVTAETYSLSEEKTKEMKKKLGDEIDRMSSANKTALPYICAALLSRGRDETKELWVKRFSLEELMFDSHKVKRQDVFHPLNVRLKNGGSNHVLPYQKIFTSVESVVILSGAAGSGKTTFLKNLTLQFFESQQANADSLSVFNFVIYIDLEDRNIQTLSEVVEEQFGNLCRDFTKEEILDALLCFDVLFLVDAFDEANSKSRSVLLELVKKVWKFNFPIIITTRPQAAKQLHQLLSKKNVTSIEYEILPLMKLEDQLKFLEKHQSYFSESTQTEEMLKCFLGLNGRVRDMFTDPVNLVLFCHLFKHRRSGIVHLEKPSQVVDEIFVLYKTVIERKLSDSDYSDLSLLIDDIFLTIGELALKFMQFSTFSEDEILQFQRRCRTTLKNDRSFPEADTPVFLSVVLQVQRPPAGEGPVTWKFHHKSIQERFASRYIKEQLTSTNLSLQQILEGADATKDQLLGTLQYVVRDLAGKNTTLLERCWPQLTKALTEAGLVSHEDWQQYMLTCRDVMQVVRQAALVSQAQKEKWDLSTGDDFERIALMLPHAQPRVLMMSKPHEGLDYVFSRSRTKVTSLGWSQLIQLREGDLELWLDTLFRNKQGDEFLLPLLGSRCRLLSFRGQVATPEGVAALMSVCTPETELFIWMLTPLELSGLQGKYKAIHVYVEPTTAAGGGRVPLPAHPAPTLIVWCTASGTFKDLVPALTTLAPAGNRLKVLWVRRTKLTSTELSDKELSDDNLDNAGRTLQKLGIRTEGEYSERMPGTPHYYRLHITDEHPLPSEAAPAPAAPPHCGG